MTLAYSNDPAMKGTVLAAAAELRLSNKYRDWEDNRPLEYVLPNEESLGVEPVLLTLKNSISEGLSAHLRSIWAERFFSSIPVGADLSCVVWQFISRILSDIHLANGANFQVQAAIEQCRAVIKQCVDAISPLTKGEPLDPTAALAASSSSHNASDTTAKITVGLLSPSYIAAVSNCVENYPDNATVCEIASADVRQAHRMATCVSVVAINLTTSLAASLAADLAACVTYAVAASTPHRAAETAVRLTGAFAADLAASRSPDLANLAYLRNIGIPEKPTARQESFAKMAGDLISLLAAAPVAVPA